MTKSGKKNKGRRVGSGMKPRESSTEHAQAPQVLAATEESLSTDAVQPNEAKTGSAAEPETLVEGSTQEAETLQNLEPENGASVAPTAHEEEREGLEDLMRDSVDAITIPAMESGAKDVLKNALSDVRLRPGMMVPVEGPQVGDHPDGTFGMVVTIREGLIDPIREQASYEKQTPEQWASERFGEWLEQWWTPAQSR